MTYEELNEMVKDWQNVGNLRVATENGNTSLHSDTGITPTVARNIIVSVWNELPRLFEEVRSSSRDRPPARAPLQTASAARSRRTR